MSAAAGAAAGATTAGGGQPPFRLPELRAELRLHPSTAGLNGERRWTVHDPLSHRFIAIDRVSYVMLQLWRAGATAAEISEQAWARHAETIEPAEIERFARFLEASGSTVEAPGGGWRRYYTDTEARRGAWGAWLLHSYLFFRIPLLQPERFLRATLWLVRPLGTRRFGLGVAALGLAGTYLVSREWEAFTTTFADAFSLEGAALLAVSMVLVKLLHELGHAYTATQFGCRVPVIGVALVLGMPMLYCDVSDAWRLEDRRRRLLVDSAGVMVDLAVACAATFAWAFLPPGFAKSMAFSLATAGWILSLTMNLNPFMKFDGYHIAADALGIENMQSRAMTIARWRLREILFGIGIAPPEALPVRPLRLLALYGWAIWIYRLVLFTGIALAVYAFFFKLAGIVLFAVEIGYFIAAPLAAELREWWRMRKLILASWRTGVTLAVLAGLVALLVVPWSSQVTIPAVLEAEGLARIYPPIPAQVLRVAATTGAKVAAGDVLVSLDAPAVREELRLVGLKLDLVHLRQSRRAADAADREDATVLDQEHTSLMQRRAGLLAQLAELELRAPFAGEVVEIAPELHPGRWVNLKEAVIVVRAPQRAVARGLIEAGDVWRIGETARGRFVPDDVWLAPVEARLTSIAPAGTSVIDQVELAQTFGGRVANRLDPRRMPVPVAAQYAVRAAVSGELADAYHRKTVAGVLLVDGLPESFAAGLWRQSLRVLVRESGL